MGVALTQLVPFSELTPGQAGAIRNAIVNQLVKIATTALKVTEDNIVVRDIRPKGDLDYTYEDWGEVTGATADAYETMTTGTMGTDRWVGIFGVRVDKAGFACSMLKFNISGADKAIWQLQCLREEDDFVGFSPSGVIITQSQPYTISRYVRSVTSPSIIVLKGVVVERKGKVITP